MVRTEVVPISLPMDTVLLESWHRSRMSGLSPDSCLAGDDAITDVNPEGRLLRVATPVLDRVESSLAGTDYAVLLADAQARVVDIRAGQRSVREQVDRSGVVPGRSMAEELAGTNAIGTVVEIRRGIAVRGDEHFAAALRDFSCYGHPIVHPLTRRVVGILDISCPIDQENPLLAPFLTTAARDIEERLGDAAGPLQREVVVAFRRATARRPGRPVVAIGHEVYLASTSATRILGLSDHVALNEAARPVPIGGSVTGLALALGGRQVRASIWRYAAGSVIAFDPVEGSDSAGATATPACTGSVAVTTRPRVRGAASGVTLICGEPGTGRRTTAAQRLAGAGRVRWFAGAAAAADQQAWLTTVTTALIGGGAVGIADVHLLGAWLAHELAEVLAAHRDRASAVLTGPVLEQLTGEHARLAAVADARVELAPLRARRQEIPALVQELVRRHGVDVRVLPEAMDALVGQDWPGNIAELEAVVDQAVVGRRVGEIGLGSLPVGYRHPDPARHLSAMEQAQRGAILDALRAAGGNKSAAADLLGISRTTLYRAIRRYRIVG